MSETTPEEIVPAREKPVQADGDISADKSRSPWSRLPISVSGLLAMIIAAIALWVSAGQDARIDELENRLALLDAQLARNVEFTASLNKRQVDLEQHFGDLVKATPPVVETPAEAPQPEMQEKPGRPPHVQQGLPAPSAPTQADRQPQAPAAAEERQATSPAAPEPKAGPTEGTEGPWKVNLVSVTSEAAARKEVKRLRELGIKANYTMLNIKGKPWYRIQVAGYASKEEALKAARELGDRLGMKDIWVGR